MSIPYMQIRISGLPLLLAIGINRTIAVCRMQPVTGIVDNTSALGVEAIFTDTVFSINGKYYKYNQAYSPFQEADLVKWLKAQNLDYQIE